MERFKNIMDKCGIKVYTVTSTDNEIAELFFIRKKLDMKRIEKTTEISMSVYKDMEADGKKLRGRADIIASASMSDDELIEKIKSADYAAQYVKNPYYKLPDREVSDEVVMESDLNGLSLSEIADKFVEAVYSMDNDEEAFINNLELFVEESHVHIVNSEGTDVSYVKRGVKGEFVAQCKLPQDVETYQNFDYDSLALNDIKELISRTLTMTKDRAKATNMPKAGTYDVIISDKYIPEIISFYPTRAHASLIFPGYSDYKIGDNVQGEGVTGELLNITLTPSVPFNNVGIKMIERPLLENGVLKTIHGDHRFTYYLGVEQIGTYSKVTLPAGTVSFSEMKKKPSLHVVNFSDFQMDPMDGHFKGEIRLAYLTDDKGNVECVTGGSINGSIFEAQKNFVFSKETENLSEYVGPKAVLLKNVAVAGE